MESIPDICFEIATWWDNRSLQRVIVCAANRYTLEDGGVLVIPSIRHYSPEHHKILDQIPNLKSSLVYGDNQGFIDQFGNYWTREQALTIATHAGQINTRREKTFPEDELFSEDLY